MKRTDFYKLLLLINISLWFSLSVKAVKTGAGEEETPVPFLQNKGQWPADILYKGMSFSTNVYLLNDGLSFSQKEEEEDEEDEENYDSEILVWNMKFRNIRAGLQIEGGKGRESVYSFLSGTKTENRVIHPYEYRSVHYRQLYKNIDLEFYGNGDYLEYDYILHPGSNMIEIQGYYEGIRHLTINSKGDLEVSTAWNTQIQKAPVAWQIIGGVKHPVKVHYVLMNDSTFGFTASDRYNKNYDLVIDPLFQMAWSSYTSAIGTSNNLNYCFGSAMDKAGNVYLTGIVDGTFPTTAGAYSGPGNVYPEVFVAKFSSDGTTMLYSTYLPGNSSEFGAGIAVDESGRAYVTGQVDLNFTGVTNFPSTANAYQPVHNPGADAFLTVLNPAGTGLVYSSFLGGTGSDAGYSVALGGPGIAYITGSTSTGNFPVVASSVFPTGDNDLFVAKFDINQSGTNSLVYSTRIGGGAFNSCYGRSIAVNNAGNAYITGKIFSTGTPTFPITPGAYNTVFYTGQDGVMSFVTKLSATTPVTLGYSTFLAPGTANAIAVDTLTGDAFVVGATNTFAFPVTAGALQPTHAGANGTDAFAMRLNATGSALVYSTLLGGYWGDVGTGVAINSNGEAYVVGISQDSFPTSAGAYQPNNAGTYDFFVVNLNAAGTGYGCGGSTYVGGSDADYAGSFYDYSSPQVSIINHGGNNDTICVAATTHSQNFPTTPGAYQTLKVNGIADQPVFFKMTCTMSVAPPVAAFTSAITTSCTNASVDFSDNTQDNPTSWQWTFPGAVPGSSTAQDPTGISYSNSGQYNVSLVACNQFGCDSMSTTILVHVPQPVSLNHGNDTVICNGNSVALVADTGFASYSWQQNGNPVGANLNTLNANQSGAYSVVAADLSGCASSDTIDVTIENPVAAFDYTVEFDCSGTHVETENNSLNAAQYLWDFGDGYTTNEISPVHSYAVSQNQWILLTAMSGVCSDTSGVEAISPKTPAFSEIPNVITPDGDGKNDCFRVEGVDGLSECFSLNVYNRWGTLVFESEGTNTCWNGKNMNNTELTAGVYFYIISINDKKVNGTVQLIR